MSLEFRKLASSDRIASIMVVANAFRNLESRWNDLQRGQPISYLDLTNRAQVRPDQAKKFLVAKISTGEAFERGGVYYRQGPNRPQRARFS